MLQIRNLFKSIRKRLRIETESLDKYLSLPQHLSHPSLSPSRPPSPPAVATQNGQTAPPVAKMTRTDVSHPLENGPTPKPATLPHTDEVNERLPKLSNANANSDTSGTELFMHTEIR